MDPYVCDETEELCPVAGIDVDDTAAALGFTVTQDEPYPCWNQIGLQDLNPCEVMSNPSTPSWVKCVLQSALTPKVL